MTLRVLVPTMSLVGRTGAELHVAEISRELSRRGHRVEAVATLVGPLAAELRADGIRVTNAVRRTATPDVIHGQGMLPTTAAIDRHRSAPAMFVSHHHQAWNERLSPHPNVLVYAGVSNVCVQAVLAAGAPPERTRLLPNFVDTVRFAPRDPLPPTPRRALVFSNYAEPGGFVDAVGVACARAGLALDVVGAGSGRPSSRPEEVLGAYDVVFAKGRAAMEAIAVGCAVVLFDFAGLGPMVTSDGYDRLRPMNFGFESLTRPHDPDLIVAELERYDPADVARVRDRLRTEASLVAHVDRLESVYGEMLAEGVGVPAPPLPFVEKARVTAATVAYRGWHRLPRRGRRMLTALLPPARRAVYRHP